MFIAVCYDISDDKKRAKVAHKLKDYGIRVQKSVFECILNEEKLKEMIEIITKDIDEEEDTLRIYQICETCKKKIKIYGFGKLTEDEEVYIV